MCGLSCVASLEVLEDICAHANDRVSNWGIQVVGTFGRFERATLYPLWTAQRYGVCARLRASVKGRSGTARDRCLIVSVSHWGCVLN